ncbi:MAG: hypothetical protein LBN93_11580 [Candidatus Symbiothrix sp.]|jgi:hypothetical protein|nr:hypothetical protein [Candidatus Symbiothrix sp.]
MKKILYSFAVLLALCVSGCEEADNLSKAGEKGPLVTIYSYTIPAGADDGSTVNLRFVPNQDVADFYVLIEKKADKDAFLASHTESEYADRVVSTGTKYSKETNYLNETLAAIYAITAVGVNVSGVKGEPVEFIFNGIEWFKVDPFIYVDGTFKTFYNVTPLPMYVQTETATVNGNVRYRFKNAYRVATAVSGGIYDGFPYNDPGDFDESKTYNTVIEVDKANKVSMLPGEIGVNWGNGMFSIGSIYPTVSTSVASYPLGTLVGDVITFPASSLYISMALYNNGGKYICSTPTYIFRTKAAYDAR